MLVSGALQSGSLALGQARISPQQDKPLDPVTDWLFQKHHIERLNGEASTRGPRVELGPGVGYEYQT